VVALENSVEVFGGILTWALLTMTNEHQVRVRVRVRIGLR
jgi:hypothetical protein